MTQLETRVTPWRECVDGPWYPTMSHGGFAAYRIWQQTDGRRWFQRHEWRHADDTTSMEPWIDGVAYWGADMAPIEEAA